MSRLTQARGLKQDAAFVQLKNPEVAPHAGAWIETIFFTADIENYASRLTQARGLKLLSAFIYLKGCCRASRRRVD